ncbi:hypothetical protein Leryth_018926 [Lithospermum erythrorhizon]|nr:hypothetical protein Leryth_018926 [Lithospermum erythrorhizon]
MSYSVAESFNIQVLFFGYNLVLVFQLIIIISILFEKEPELDVKLPFMPLLKYDEVPSLLHPSTPLPYKAFRRLILSQYQNLSKPFCILMDTVKEFEDDWLRYMSKFFNIKPIGPLFKISDPSCSRIKADILKADSVVDFLDSKPVSSVLYISFGTVVTLKQRTN